MAFKMKPQSLIIGSSAYKTTTSALKHKAGKFYSKKKPEGWVIPEHDHMDEEGKIHAKKLVSTKRTWNHVHLKNIMKIMDDMNLVTDQSDPENRQYAFNAAVQEYKKPEVWKEMVNKPPEKSYTLIKEGTAEYDIVKYYNVGAQFISAYDEAGHGNIDDYNRADEDTKKTMIHQDHDQDKYANFPTIASSQEEFVQPEWGYDPHRMSDHWGDTEMAFIHRAQINPKEYAHQSVKDEILKREEEQKIQDDKEEAATTQTKTEETALGTEETALGTEEDPTEKINPFPFKKRKTHFSKYL